MGSIFYWLMKEIFNMSSLGLAMSTVLFCGALYIVHRRRQLTPPLEPLNQGVDDSADILFHDSPLTTNLPNEMLAFLSSIEVLGYFEEPVFMELVKHTQTMQVVKGTALFRPGDSDRSLFVVTKGLVHVYIDQPCEENLINQVHAGHSVTSLFNILSVLTGQEVSPLNVSAIAEEDTDLVKLPLEAFRGLMDKFPSAVTQIVQVIMTRFQRVTFATLNKYFGLTTELINPEAGQRRVQTINKPTSEMSKSELRALVTQALASVVGLGKGSPAALSSTTDVEVSLDGELEFHAFSRDSVLLAHGARKTGIYFVVEGKLQVNMQQLNGRRLRLYEVEPGGVVGHLTVLTGFGSFLEIVAATDVRVGFLSKASFDKLADMYPMMWLSLAKSFIPELSPLVRQIDFALGWIHINAGKVLHSQNDQSNAIYFVLNGRLRAIHSTNDLKNDTVCEYGQGESVGDLEVLTAMPYRDTIFAVRDSELARIPKMLFATLAARYPQVTMQISRLVAVRSQERLLVSQTNKRQRNIKTVTLLPANGEVPIEAFGLELQAALAVHSSCQLLNSAAIIKHLGKNAFNRMGGLKLLAFLGEQEEAHRIILYQADQVNSPWTRRCIRQADVILVVTLAAADASLGEFELLLQRTVKTTARKELVLLHTGSSVPPSTTHRWLKKRPWVHVHHHMQLQQAWTRRLASVSQSSSPSTPTSSSPPTGPPLSPLPSTLNVRSDMARLARHLAGRSVGVVLGGGGARGLAHIGILKALEEAGIPVDILGGTSMGAFIAALYARDPNHLTTLTLAAKFCTNMSSTWRLALDLTYPVAAWLSGRSFNAVLSRCLGSQQMIEDCWLNYFCNTTNITKSRMEVHRSGLMWRYVRASMSLAGFLPPLCDRGDMLLDGGYMDNLPVSVMSAFSGADRIIAVDVGAPDDMSPMEYGDTLSGWWVLWQSVNLFGNKTARVRAPTIADIQAKLAYVSSVRELEAVKTMSECVYVQPPVSHFATLDFTRCPEIVAVGHQHGRELIETWRQQGVFSEFIVKPQEDGRRARRLSF